MSERKLLKERAKFAKTVIFCRTLLDCGKIYGRIKRLLGRNVTEPSRLLNIIEFCLINLFTAASTAEMRANCPDIRRVINFGAPIDIRRVINFGAPITTEELIQQSVGAGWDGNNAELYFIIRKLVSTPLH